MVAKSRCIKFDLELKKNILKFGYGINYKYKGMLVHSLNFDHTCAYMNKEYAPNKDSRKYLTELKTYCNKIKPFVSHYNNLIISYNATVYNILENEIKPLLPQISRQRCDIITTLVSGFIGLAYEGIFSFPQEKCENVNVHICNAKTLEKLINTVQEIHNVTSSHEKLFAGEQNPTIFRLLYKDVLGIQQYAFNSLLFPRVIQDKYISLYRELITQLRSYVSAIRVLVKGYLPTTLITPSKLQGIMAQVKQVTTAYQSILCLSFRKTAFVL